MSSGNYKNISDAELLDRYYVDRDQRWLGILLDRYTLLLYGVCMKYLKDEHAAQDAVQQIFLKVLTDAGKYKIDYFKSWLYMVAKNYCLMQLRNAGGKETKELSQMHLASPDTSPSEIVDKEQAYTKLEEALTELNEEQRQCVILFYLHKNSYQQISEKTGYTPMQVKSYIQNGKRNLKIILERKMQESK